MKSSLTHEAAARTIQRILVHEVDPISLRPIRTRFALLRNGVLIMYDAHTLGKYVASSGDIRDPIARQELAKHEHMRLERVTRLPLLSIAELKNLHHDMVSARDFIQQLRDQVQLESSQTSTLTSSGMIAVASDGEWRFIRFSSSDLSQYMMDGEGAQHSITATDNTTVDGIAVSSDTGVTLSIRTPPPVTRWSAYMHTHTTTASADVALRRTVLVISPPPESPS